MTLMVVTGDLPSTALPICVACSSLVVLRKTGYLGGGTRCSYFRQRRVLSERSVQMLSVGGHKGARGCLCGFLEFSTLLGERIDVLILVLEQRACIGS